MILVTVGTHSKGFDRLVKAMDEVAARFDERVVIQRGSGTYEPVHAEHFQFTSSQEMQTLTHEARVVVTHAAAGAVLVGLCQNKPLVVVPRLPQFGEVIDDHQKQLAAALDGTGKAVAVQEPTAASLCQAIERVVSLQVANEGARRLNLALRCQLTEWDASVSQADVLPMSRV